jgi:hypothetical protein
VLIEYCRYGNLLSYLIKHRKSFVNQVNSEGYLVPMNETAVAAFEAEGNQNALGNQL